MRSFLLGMMGLPIFVQFVLQCLTQVAFPLPSYGFCLWGLAGIVLFAFLKTWDESWRWKLASFWVIFASLLEIASLPIQTAYTYWDSPKASIRFYPGKEMAAQADKIWETRFPGRVCPFVAGGIEEFPVWNVAVYSKFQPHIITSIGNWASDEDLRNQGGMILWENPEISEKPNIPEEIEGRFPGIQFAENVVLNYEQKNPNIPPLSVGVGVLAPHEETRVP